MSDVIRRLALHDEMTEEEDAACNKIVSELGMYVLVNAVFRKANQSGLKVGINLRHPRPRGTSRKKVNG